MYDDTTMCVKYGTCNILYYLILFKSKKSYGTERNLHRQIWRTDRQNDFNIPLDHELCIEIVKQKVTIILTTARQQISMLRVFKEVFMNKFLLPSVGWKGILTAQMRADVLFFSASYCLWWSLHMHEILSEGTITNKQINPHNFIFNVVDIFLASIELFLPQVIRVLKLNFLRRPSPKT